MRSSVRISPVALLQLAAIVWCTILVTDGLRFALDPHAADEARYLAQGRALLEGRVLPETFGWAPLTSLLLAQTEVFVTDRIASDALQPILIGLQAITLRWLLCAFLPHTLATLSACLWLSCDALFGAGFSLQPSPYALTYALMFLGLGFWVRGGRVTAGVTLLLAAIDRPELVVPIGCIALVAFLGGGSFRERTGRALVPLTVALVGLLPTLFSEPHRARAWLAFEQHYGSYTTMREARASGADEAAVRLAAQEAGMEPEAILQRDFGDVGSLGQAIQANPEAYATFAWNNLRELPKRFDLLIGSPARWALRMESWFGLLLLALWTAVMALPGSRARWMGFFRELGPTRRAAILGGLGSILATIFLAPKTTVLFGCVPFLLVVFGSSLTALTPARLRKALGPVLLTAFLALLTFGPSRYPDLPVEWQPRRVAIDLAARFVPEVVVVVWWAPSSYDLFGIEVRGAPTYAALDRVNADGPRLIQAADAPSVDRFWTKDPDYVIVPFWLLDTAPRFILDLIGRVHRADFKIIDVSPDFALYTRYSHSPSTFPTTGGFGTPLDDAWLSALQSSDPARQDAAVRAAGLVTTRSSDLQERERAVGALLKLAPSLSDPIRLGRVAWALGRLGSARANEFLTGLLDHADARVCVAACHALTCTANGDANVVERTRGLTSSPNDFIARVARNALRLHGS